MTRTQPIKAIILDAFDTTLVLEENLTAYNPFKEMLRDMNIESPSQTLSNDRDMLLTQPTTFSDYFARHASNMPTAEAMGIMGAAEALLKYQYNAYHPRPEWQDFVQQAADRDIALCIGSNLATPYKVIIEKKLAAVPHHAFSCDMGVMKPQAEFFHQCCDMMGVKPEQTVMVGNSYSSDIIGARNAKLADAFWLPKNNVRPSQDNNTTTLTKLTDIFAHPHI